MSMMNLIRDIRSKILNSEEIEINPVLAGSGIKKTYECENMLENLLINQFFQRNL